MFNLQAITEGSAITLMLVGMSVVFVALVILMFLMKGLKAGLSWLHNRRMTGAPQVEGTAPGPKPGEIPAGVVAAIALTLILEEDQIHDDDSLVLTLHSLPRPYSNWWMREMARPWQDWQHRLHGEKDPH